MPPNWDSWGKIRVLGGSFDAELVSKHWAEDIKIPLGSTPPSLERLVKDNESDVGNPDQVESAIALYEDWCRDPNSGGLAVVESAMNDGTSLVVESDDTQEFLERQLKILEAFKAKIFEKTPDNTASSATRKVEFLNDKTVNEHIGPVQFNMGGIQVDADDMLQRLKVSDSGRHLGRQKAHACS